MKRQGAPFDPSEPPGGDFVRYVEGLDGASTARTPEAGAGQPARARQALARDPAAAPPAPNGDVDSAVDASGTDGPPDWHLPQAGNRRPAGWGPTTPLRRLSAWMIGAGIGLLVAALLFAGGPLADIYLPGMLLLGAGLALRRHLRRR